MYNGPLRSFEASREQRTEPVLLHARLQAPDRSVVPLPRGSERLRVFAKQSHVAPVFAPRRRKRRRLLPGPLQPAAAAPGAVPVRGQLPGLGQLLRRLWEPLRA